MTGGPVPYRRLGDDSDDRERNPEDRASWISRLLYCCVCHIGNCPTMMTAEHVCSLRDDSEDMDRNPEDRASWISRLLYCWILPLVNDIKKGQGYKASTLPPCRQEDKSKELHIQFSRVWELETGKSMRMTHKPSLLRCLMKTRRLVLFINTTGSVIFGVAPFAQTIMVGRIVDYFVGATPPVYHEEAYCYGAALVILTFVQSLAANHVINQCYRLGQQCRAVLTSAMYKKILTVEYGKLNAIGCGKLLTNFSTDLETIFQGFPYLYAAAPPFIGIPLGTYLLYCEAGVWGLAGLMVPTVIISLLFCLQPMVSQLRQREAQCTEQRMQIMNELIKAITVVKMYCWEKPFSHLVANRRRLELHRIMRGLFPQIMQQINYFVGEGSSHFVAVMVITNAGIYMKQGLIVRVFGYTDVCCVMLVQFSFFLFKWTEAYKSLRRIEDFLLEDANSKRAPCHGSYSNNNDIHCEVHVGLEKVSAMWGDSFYLEKIDDQWIKQPNSFSLKDLSMTFQPAEFIAIAGSVGCGKTSLLMTVLGYLRITSGSCHVNGSVAYVPQEPWIFSDTVQNNILFGEEFNFSWYSDVIIACGLQKDINHFQCGDKTIVGERGLQLSGGQKARISLARAVYQNKDIYILDDPLSAVDVHVGNHLLHACLSDILSKKMRILVTHNAQCLTMVDRIILMDKGKVGVIGKHGDIKRHLPADINAGNRKSDVSVGNSVECSTKYVTNEVSDRETVEQSERGNISWDSLTKYFIAGHGYFTLMPTIVITLLFQASISFADWWAADWSRDFDHLANPSVLNTSNYNMSSEHREVVYSVTIVCNCLLAFMACVTLLTFVYFASKNVHDMMFRLVLKTSITFFYKTPIGIILNRFPSDLGQVDKFIYGQMAITMMICARVIGILAMSCLVVPWMGVAMVFCIILLLIIRHYGSTGLREFKRLEAVCRSPIFSYVSTTLDGLVTIRVFKKEEQFMQALYKLQDKHNSAFSIYFAFTRWMCIYGSWTGATFLTTLLLASFILQHFESMNGGLLGIVFIQNISLIMHAQRGLYQSTELENTLTCVERVLSYTTLTQEENELESILPPDSWPTEGSITFQDVCMKYDGTGPYVLRNISLVIKSKEKVGVVGRTGAGKSSLLCALMRLVQCEGRIHLDGIDINTLKLEHLRKTISVIPQDPVLFSGTLRNNLDPFGEFTDDAIWVVLTQVQMAEYVASTDLQLDTEAGEYGGHISVGQKQLMCLARALLRRNKILVMDEATANVDHRTDTLIQDTIRKNFLDCTVITIAHRINTILDSDRILVLSGGEVVEFDSPETLLRNERSIFYNMLDAKKDLEVIAQVGTAATEAWKFLNKPVSK